MPFLEIVELLGFHKVRHIVITIWVLCLLSAVGGVASAQEKQIRFCYWANFVDNDFFRRVCEQFEEENPGIRVKREWYVGDYGRKLQLVLVTNTAPEIILMDDEIFPTYAIRGYLEDLRPYIMRRSDKIEQDLADELEYMETPEEKRDPNFERVYLPTALASFNYRGFQGGLPWDGNSIIMFYNKDIFDAEGIPYPHDNWTYDEFRDIARRLTKDVDGDGNLDQFGTNLAFGFLGFEPFLWSFGGEVLNEDFTKSAIHGPRSVEAAQFIYDMKYKDHSIAWSGEMEGFGTEVQILTGRLAMVPAGSYMIPTLNRVKDAMRWDVAHMPIGPHGDRYTRVTWDGISLNAHASPEMKEIGWRFIKLLLSDEIQRDIGGNQRGVPVRRKIAEETYPNPETPAREEVAIEAFDYGKLTPLTPRYLELRDAMQKVFDVLNTADARKEDTSPALWIPKLEPLVNQVLEKDLEEWGAPPKKHDPYSWQKASGLTLIILMFIVGGFMLVPPIRKHFLQECQESVHMLKSRMMRQEALEGFLFASPWIIGLFLFTAFPIAFSILLSFCEWDPYKSLDKIEFIGLSNFIRAFSSDPVHGDPLVRKALYNTFYFAVFSVPLNLALSLGLALLLNQKIRGITIFRTTFYLPSIVAGVATVILWMYIFNPINGPLNAFLRWLNYMLDKSVIFAFIDLPVPQWLSDPAWAKPAMIIMRLWGAGGGGMLIFLAGLQGVPDQLYEVADLDGASRLRKFWNITLPMLTPTIYFNLIMGMIGSLQIFMQAFIITNGTGGIDNSLLFYVVHLYIKAFVHYEMGYASALAWILFVIILAMTMLVIRSSAVWVYYEGEKKA